MLSHCQSSLSGWKKICFVMFCRGMTHTSQCFHAHLHFSQFLCIKSSCAKSPSYISTIWTVTARPLNTVCKSLNAGYVIHMSFFFFLERNNHKKKVLDLLRFSARLCNRQSRHTISVCCAKLIIRSEYQTQTIKLLHVYTLCGGCIILQTLALRLCYRS